MAIVVVNNDELTTLCNAALAAKNSIDWGKISSIGQFVTAVVALFVSGVALYISHRQAAIAHEQAKIAREHNIKSTNPHLDLLFDSEAPNTIALYLRNSGGGPALVHDMVVDLAGMSFPINDKRDFLSNLLSKLDLQLDSTTGDQVQVGVFAATPGVAWVLAPLSRQSIFKITYADDFSENIDKLIQALSHTKLIFEYDSSYESGLKFMRPIF